MRHLKGNTVLKLSLGIVMAVCFTMNSYSFWACNMSETGFTVPKTMTISEPSIGDLIVQGAISFLDSYSYTLQYMKKTESASIDGLNALELKTLLKKALSSMVLASDYYGKLKAAADNTPYNTTVIEALRTFDFEGFMKSNEGYIDRTVFEEVKAYLISGDIRGIYAAMYSKTGYIKELLKQLNDLTNSGVIPSLPETWKANHLFSQTLLFGQYTAQVFDSVLKNSR